MSKCKHGGESKRSADKFRGMSRKNQAQGAGQKAQGENKGYLHYLLSLSPEPYAFGHGISYAAVTRDEGNAALRCFDLAQHRP
jgi:hypothetical protein